jgi:hypothetical protein
MGLSQLGRRNTRVVLHLTHVYSARTYRVLKVLPRDGGGWCFAIGT